ncbi:hypothetical protein [Pueribacillus sp. YX66]|uniref:hypothetical protein n=1 Tax=Pueribacillus sp. YX66 TaxID=3229242 RepID=UPI00358D99ED
MQRIVMSVFIHAIIWLLYLAVIIFSPEDRMTAKLCLLVIFIYLASVISFVIGRSKRFVFVSLCVSTFCFSFILFVLYLLV